MVNLEFLRRPDMSLLAFAQVQDQKTGQQVAFHPESITYELQNTIVSYYSDPGLTKDGQNQWLTLLGYRQAGKSLTAELCAYVKAAYNPLYDHVCIADTKPRAEYLHARVHFTHAKWPEPVRSPTVPNREVRQMTFEGGGKMRILSSESGNVGIGQSPDSWHASELPFWADAGSVYNLAYPSIVNRDHAIVCLESTPSPGDYPSADWWKDQCHDAQLGKGRYVYAFFPFWDGKLNARPWDETWRLDNDEIRLLEKYGELGLRRENLAFRRLMLETDSEIRKNPDLFGVFYPFDDVSCWQSSSSSVIHESLLKRHENGILAPWVGPYMEYESPEEGAIYVIGVDPAGYAARDHASFQVLKVYRGEWTQVACYAGHVEPIPFAEAVLAAHRRFNGAMVVVESNGVGTAVLALLEEKNCRNLFYEKPYKPGFTSTSKTVDQCLSWLQEALKDELVLRDKDTVSQLKSYKHDKRTERNVSAEMLHGGAGRGRRDRHHWDKVSALQMALVAARMQPSREKAKSDLRLGNVVPFTGMSYNEIQGYRAAEASTESPRRRSRYISVRRKK